MLHPSIRKTIPASGSSSTGKSVVFFEGSDPAALTSAQGRFAPDRDGEEPRMTDRRSLAYFSMEVGLVTEIPTYSGGLGVLAGDTIRAAADLALPMVAVTLLHRKGYFRQVLSADGHQSAEPVNWVVADFLTECPVRAAVTLEGRSVGLRAWKYEVRGVGGFTIPVYFLDSRLPENTEGDQSFTDSLYGGDARYRLCQELILGVGGVRILRALGYKHLEKFHVNEGHAALLSVELLEERLRHANRSDPQEEDIDAVRRSCVFTTHTPVPAGHDRFPKELVGGVLDPSAASLLGKVKCLDGVLNMTLLAQTLSARVNGVSRRHAEVSRKLLSSSSVQAITNGIHAPTWASVPVAEMFDRYIAHWREDNFQIRMALQIPHHEIWNAHRQAKLRLLDFVNRETNVAMNLDYFTIGFARRAALYKRADLLFDELDRLVAIHESSPIQIILAGKAHPNDQGAKELIQQLFQARDRLRGKINVVYLENYDIRMCRLMVGGVDLWLNTPEPPLEASGTSGMKAALNGVPSLSVLDGWWVEGCMEGITGWSIGRDEYALGNHHDRKSTAAEIYSKLEFVILPLFFRERERFIDVMKHSIALNGSHFSTHRMMEQYVASAYT